MGFVAFRSKSVNFIIAAGYWPSYQSKMHYSPVDIGLWHAAAAIGPA